MKLRHIPRAHISPVMRMIMVNQDQTNLIVKIPSTVTDEDAQGCIDFAADSARLNIMRGYTNFAKSFMAELNAMNMGFEVLEMPFMVA